MFNLPIIDKLRNSRSVLLAGAGGGYDVLGAVPLAIDPWGHVFESWVKKPKRRLDFQLCHMDNFRHPEVADDQLVSHRKLQIAG